MNFDDCRHIVWRDFFVTYRIKHPWYPDYGHKLWEVIALSINVGHAIHEELYNEP